MPLEPSNKPTMGISLKLHHKLAITFSIFTMLISGLTAFLLYETASGQVMKDIRRRLHDVTSAARYSIDTDLHSALIRPEQENSAGYMAIKRVLQHIRDTSTDIHFIYTMRQGPDGEILFVVDAESDPEEIAHLGERYEKASPLLKKTFASMDKPVIESDIYEDKWGRWLSGYAPIMSPEGRRVGVLGVDISADTVVDYRRNIFYLALGIFFLTIPITLTIGYLAGWRLAKPIITLRDSALRIGGGDLDQVIQVRRGDEIGSLAEAFNEMAANLRTSRAELKAMMEDYRDIFDNAIEGLYKTSPDGRFLAANRSLVALFGYDSFEEFSEAVTDLGRQVYCNPQDYRVFINRLNQEHLIESMEVQFRRKDGSEFWAEMNAVMSRRGDEVFIQGMVQDITQRMERDQAEKDRRAAEYASQAKSDFLANMSHEIRTPLNAVMGLTDLVLKTELNERQREYLGKIKTSSRSLLAVINDILDLSKIEAGRMELEETGFSLYEVMANLSEMFAHTAHEKDIELMVSIDPDAPNALIGDPIRLGQVLINLTGNALKFTEKGEILVSVELDPSGPEPTEDAVHLRFAVKDTGSGIPKARLEKIFESFTQADSSITRRHGGAGLGLSICRSISRLMGGDIWAESELGEGSVFYFTAVFRRQPEDRQIKTVPPRDLRGLKVLVVDDNNTSREILTSFIQSFHMDSVAASSGEGALEIIKKGDIEFDLILLDWKMPGLNGIETARMIREKLGLSKLPIICMISAYVREDLLPASEQSLLEAFLHKPINQSLLFDTIMELFGRGGGSMGSFDLTRQAEHTRDFGELLKGKKVLLAEDNKINQEIALEWLESVGLRVDVASDGLAAVDLTAAGDYDAVLMDIQMPVMDGYAAVEKIRDLPGLSELPIIAMTAHALSGDREKCLNAGMNDYITKPIDPDKLFSTLVKWVAGRELIPEPVESGAPPEVDFPDLPGLDVKTGLYRTNGNVRLYLKILRSFAAEYNGAFKVITRDLREGRLEEVSRQAHSLKGVGGGIGAMDLHQRAALVEVAVAQNKLDENSSMWIEFGQALEQVLGGLSDADFTGLEQTSEQAVMVPPEQLADQLKKILDLLDEDLEQARTILESLKPAAAQTPHKDLFEDLAEKIDDFDLDQGAEILEQLIELFALSDNEE